MSKWIVELEPGVFLGPSSGDTDRCLDARNAQIYDSHPRASRALLAAQKLRPFEQAQMAVLLLPTDEEEANAGDDMMGASG